MVRIRDDPWLPFCPNFRPLWRDGKDATASVQVVCDLVNLESGHRDVALIREFFTIDTAA